MGHCFGYNKKMMILGICGGKRGGKTDRLLKRALKSAPCETDIIYLSWRTNYRKEIRRMIAADGLVLATPVHWYNVSKEMKALIDEMPDGPRYPFDGKPVMFIAVCNEDGGQQAINSMMAPLNGMGFVVPPYAGVFHNTSIRGHGEVGWQLADIKDMGKRLAAFIEETTTAAITLPPPGTTRTGSDRAPARRGRGA